MQMGSCISTRQVDSSEDVQVATVARVFMEIRVLSMLILELDDMVSSIVNPTGLSYK